MPGDSLVPLDMGINAFHLFLIIRNELFTFNFL